MTNNYFAKLNSSPQALLKTLHPLCLLISRMNILVEACWAVCASHIFFRQLVTLLTVTFRVTIHIRSINLYIIALQSFLHDMPCLYPDGCVQEEIMFVENPECLISLLLCEKMEPNESYVDKPLLKLLIFYYNYGFELYQDRSDGLSQVQCSQWLLQNFSI